jgi:hypothetical protein
MQRICSTQLPQVGKLIRFPPHGVGRVDNIKDGDLPQ